MTLTLEKLKEARDNGYSDKDISSFLIEQNPKIGEALSSGYSLDDVAGFYSKSPESIPLKEREQYQALTQVPEAINRAGGLPVGGEPMVTGPDILAQEPGQTKTFMEGEPVKIESESGRGKITSFVEGKPVEVRRAQAIDIKGNIIPEPISPDGMTLDARGKLIKEKQSASLNLPEGHTFQQFVDASNAKNAELDKLRQAQQKHEANQIGFLSQLVSAKPGVEVPVETGLGEPTVGGAVGKITNIPIQSRKSAAIKLIGDQREFIDNIIGNDKFLDYAKTKGIDVPGMMSRMAGQYLNVGEAPDRIEQLKRNPEVRKLAEEWAMTSPGFKDYTTDLFKRAWDQAAGAVGSGTVAPIGLILKEAGYEQSGQQLIDAAEYADQMRLRGQDPRKVGEWGQFGRDLSGGLGFTIAAISTGWLGNTARAKMGLNAPRVIDLFQKANTLTFSGLNSAWQGYGEAKKSGATEDQANQAALFTALTQAPLELVSPLQKWVSRFEPTQQARLYKGLYKAAEAVVEGAEEAFFNEMPQEIAGNIVKKYVYNPNQDIFEGVTRAGEVGGASGLIASIFTQMIAGKRAKLKSLQGDQEGSEEIDIESKADDIANQLAPDKTSDLAQQMVSIDGDINNLRDEIANDEMGLQAFEEGTAEYQAAKLSISQKKSNLDALQAKFDSLSAGPAEKVTPTAKAEAKPSATKEEAQAKIEELNKEFDALDENDQAGIDRVNKAIFAEQNKIAELTAIEQGIDPQATTPTIETGMKKTERNYPFGTFYPERPVLNAFMAATDKAIGAIQATSKRAQKLKNAIRTAVTNNAGFLAGTNTQVISSEEYSKLIGQKGPSADSGTYKATFVGGKKYLVIPDINVLQQIATKGQERAASINAALDQEARAASKKLEEEMIHLSVYQGIQDEYKGLKKPNLTEQEYIVKRLTDISSEVQRTNPNALPGVSEVYLNEKNKNLDSLTFSQEFLRMVAQRVRTGQITEDLNAIRAAEKEAFSDTDKGAIVSFKNGILNALKFLRTSIARYLGKGTSTKEVDKMLNRINSILDEYDIVKGEANYEFKDYSAAQPKGELKVAEEVAPTVKENLPVEPAVSETITPAIEARAGVTANITTSDQDTGAYHYGNGGIGADTTLDRMDVGRSTGHFGTGTYFLGKKLSKIEGLPFDIASRPLLNIDLQGLNMAKPSNVSAIRLHDGLKRFNRSIFKNEKIEFDQPSSNGSRALNEIYISLIGQAKETDVMNAMEKVESIFKNGTNDGIRTPSTYLMQELGFDGIDVRGTQLDNTDYGSVVFAKPVPTAIEARAGETPSRLYAETFELFNRYTEPQGMQTIKVEANNVEEAKNLIRRTEDYKRIKSRYPKVFSMGDPIPARGPGESAFKLEAKAGVTPEGKPMGKKSETAMKRISNGMVNDLNNLVETLKPKTNKALREYKSRTTEKGKTYPNSLISEYSVAANVFTSNAFTDGTNALNKIFTDNPDVDFYRVAQDLAVLDEESMKRAYNVSPKEQVVMGQIMYKMMPSFIRQALESDMALSAREAFALSARKVEANLAKKLVLAFRSAAQIVQYANTLRNIAGAGMVIDTYKSNVTNSMGEIYNLTKASFEDIANVVRGDRRKSVDKVVNIQSVFRKAVSLIKQAQQNPEKVRRSIRAEVAKRQNKDTRSILLEFCAGLFNTKEDKYANMIVDQTVQSILSIGMNRKGFSIDNVSNFMYQSFSTTARQMGIQIAGVPKQKAGKRSGKYLEIVKAVIGNDKSYQAFLDNLSEKMAEKFQSKEAFNQEFGELFKSLRSNEWADNLRTQAIKDATDAINYKFADLFQYLGEKRDVAQAGVRDHIRGELKGVGASNELIDKFIADVDAYLNKETNRILTDKLGFTVNEETGKVSPKPLISQKIKEEAEAQFKNIKNLKDITKLSMTDEGNFKEGLISRIITEIGMPKESATELADMLSSEIDKALVNQRSENLENELKKAEKILTDNKVKRRTNQRTLLQRLIEMANMGVLDSEMVYEAFRQTHDFKKDAMPYDAEFVNTLRAWGDRIALLPEGVIRSIEEEKMGRALMAKTKFKSNDIFSSYWYWSLLSQIGTPALNVISGVNNLLANVSVWGLYNPKSFFPMLQGMYNAIAGKQSPAVNAFLYVMRNGLNPSGMQDERRAKYPKANVIENATPENAPKIIYYLTNFGDGKINFVPDWLNSVLTNVSPRAFLRSLKATDMFLREVAFEARMASAGATKYSKSGFDIAKRQAELELASTISKGKQKEQEIIIRANEIFREQRAKNARLTLDQIEQDALETVYNQEPQGIIGSTANYVNGLLSKTQATKYIVPFTNVVANVTNEFINYTPIFSQLRLLKARQMGVDDPFTQGREDKQWELRTKGWIGFAAFAIPLILQAVQGGDEEDQENRPFIQLYAEGPRDPKQQRIWAQNGGLKYSIRIGDKYISLLGTPLVVPMAMAATYAEEIQGIKKRQEKLSEIDYGDLAAKVLVSPFAIAFVATLNQSFLTGVSDILGLTQAKDPVKEGEGIVSGIISRMLTPGALRDINKLTTNEKAVGSTWITNLLKEMPGAIQFLNRDVNYFGDPARYPSIVQEDGFGKRVASLFGRIASSENPDPAFQIMYDLELTPPSWDGSLNWSNKKRMTKDQELQFIRNAGPAMRDWIMENEDALRDPDLEQKDRQDILNSGIQSIRKQYKADLEFELGIPVDIGE